IIMVTHDAHAAEAAKSLVHLEKGELTNSVATTASR
ncbi:MAG TPA: ABC transporter ATP-binding protein, partial [Cupriavidus sp.]|nr:ABC transporter ATP-binding protein [Cupriavidus sp.]